MARAYATLLVLLMVIVGVATISIVGLNIVRSRYENTANTMTALKRSFAADDKPDWDYWTRTSSLNTSMTFVRVRAYRGNKHVRTFYSRHARRFLRDDWRSARLLKNINIRYQSKVGVYYRASSWSHRDKEHVHYEIWVSLNNVLRLFRTIFLTIVGITILGLVLGIPVIYILARRLNQPLLDLTTAAQNIVNTDQPNYQETLPVPDAPDEVHNLSLEFNRLLRSLNQQVLRNRQFVSDASHELRTPIAGIRGHVALIRRHGRDHPEIIPDSLVAIDDESLKMQHLIVSLLQLSRMDQAELARTAVDLCPLVQKVVAQLQAQVSQTINVQLPLRAVACANADSVEQILSALVMNAQKYSPERSTITVGLAVVAARVMLTVSDHGIGIPANEKPKVFDRFYRVDSSRSKQVAGTGLGLAIVQRLVELNGGQVTIADNLPRGTRFVVTLPGAQASN
ncbi:histidine protein kinase [Lacticaseibacillus thailandensis DSM 22698 = JCM 13996]|uniref:histidine kinase n=2 Tax=Lacticaseibacillus thailandensis TaxID=381741 RepID=A0A0R2CF46_9LACO|nr:histidine protein kinase [Lacticaseibacillus thailandensis DSM 22698 = JCM 13996]